MSLWWGQGRHHHARRVVEAVVAAFNARDFAALRSHLLPGFTLIDSMSDRITGRDEAVSLLQKLTSSDPQFTMHVKDITTYAEHILLTGHTTGSCGLSAQRTLWKILVRDGGIAEWRSYSADYSQPFIRTLTGEVGEKQRVSASPSRN